MYSHYCRYNRYNRIFPESRYNSCRKGTCDVAPVQNGFTAMTDENKDNPDIYPIRSISPFPETVLSPSDNLDIFAIKDEDSVRLDSVLRVALGEGVSLCQAYRLDKRLSHDEMGETWKASDLQASRNVVIYLPPLELRTNELAIEPIRQNAKHLEALEHPRIVPLLTNFTDPEHGFFSVRKFVNGKPLDRYRKEYIKRHGKLATSRIVKMLNDIARALDYAHSVDIVHGNLSSKNVIVGLDDEVYIDNFALLPVPLSATAQRNSCMAPEIAEGQAATASADVYALAAIAYELLSGRFPYSPDSMETLLPIPNVPNTVDAVIRKAMMKDPDDRYTSCGTFVKALETSFQESIKIKSPIVPPSSTSSSLWSEIASRPLLFGAALILFCAALGGFLYFESVKTVLLNVVQKKVEPISIEPDATQETGRKPPEQTPPVLPESTKIRVSLPPVEKPPPDAPTLLAPQEDVMPVKNVESVATTETMPQDEPKTMEADDPAPPMEPENLPPDPKPEESLPSEETVEPLSNPLTAVADSIRKEGEQMKLTVGGIDYAFLWCRREPAVIEGFWIQETTVTREFWQVIMKDMEQQPAYGVQLPVRQVSWNECQKFIESLNKHPVFLKNEEFTDYHFSLPTEAQWEYAQDKGMLVMREDVLEWCSDWDMEKTTCRVVRGSIRNSRDPTLRTGYEDVGFRLVLVRTTKE